MNITRQEIADAGMISKAKVSKDIERGTLKEGSFLSIVSYVLANRMLSGGIQAVTGLCPEGREEEPFVAPEVEPSVINDMISAGLITRGCTPTYHDYETSDEEFKHEG